MIATITESHKLYTDNKAAKMKSLLTCPICGTKFVKKQYSQAFCCGKCKDVYWNRRNSDRHKDPNYYENYNYEHPGRMNRFYEYIDNIGGPMSGFCDDDSDSFGCVTD